VTAFHIAGLQTLAMGFKRWVCPVPGIKNRSQLQLQMCQNVSE
jgi:hypothetical protein